MQIQENILLGPYTTFKIGGAAKFFCVVGDQFDALEAYEFAKKQQLQTFVLGGGSNILVSDSGFNGLVIKVVNKGIEVLKQDDNQVLLKVASGEVWDEVVSFAVKNNWWGIENLSHIPGSTGAIAVQNVGAYGQEASKVIESVTVFDKETHQILSFKAEDCGFEYRKSIFNSSKRGKYIIFNIIFKLKPQDNPNLSYRDLAVKFADKTPTLSELRNAVIEIRDKKFPFPTEAKKGNAGSFFKNPVLSPEDYSTLKELISKNFWPRQDCGTGQEKFEENGQIKVPAAFLIELCNLKDLRFGGAAINPDQPLVIINETGTATAADVLALATEVQKTVASKTGIELKFEPELIGFN